MTPELEQRLYDISPVFFQDAIACKKGEKTEMDTCMYWGCECGDGWFEPLKKMAFRMQVLNEYTEKRGLQIYASQIKEKWGTLEVYLDSKNSNNTANGKYKDDDLDYLNFASLIVNKARRECKEICEICGHGDERYNPIIQTKGWVSFICQDCAIKSKRYIVNDNEINQFDGPYAFLSLAHMSNESFDYRGVSYATYAGAYCAQLKPEFQHTFAHLTNPYDVFQLANTVLKPEEKTDIIAVENMREIINYRFSIPHFRSQLEKTGNFKLTFGNYFHDNFWGQCLCDDCKSIRGENVLGKMLMDERNKSL